MTAYLATAERSLRTTLTSEASDKSTAITLTGLSRYLASRPHVFLGVQMFDGDGDLIVEGAAGTFTVSVKTENTLQWEDPPVSVIDATAPETISWEGFTEEVRVVPATLTDTVSWVVVLIGGKE